MHQVDIVGLGPAGADLVEDRFEEQRPIFGVAVQHCLGNFACIGLALCVTLGPAPEAFDFGLGRARQRTEIFVLPNINGTSGIAFYGICTGVLDAFAGNA
ncbi:hypothetical protein [Paracoccus sp. (in: a-proteobacteria)]|uniref:hypothetical protein n=1 Tax=Paracoccus sp. TaxID=267 RepID=UPI0035B3A885